MTPATRAELQAIQEKLHSIDINFQVRDEGTVKFKDARMLLQNLIDQPDDAVAPPATAEQIGASLMGVVPEAFAALQAHFSGIDQKLETIELHLATLMTQPANQPA